MIHRINNYKVLKVHTLCYSLFKIFVSPFQAKYCFGVGDNQYLQDLCCVLLRARRN